MRKNEFLVSFKDSGKIDYLFSLSKDYFSKDIASATEDVFGQSMAVQTAATISGLPQCIESHILAPGWGSIAYF